MALPTHAPARLPFRPRYTISPTRKRIALAAFTVIVLVWIAAFVLRPFGPRIDDPLDLAWYSAMQQIRFPAMTTVALVFDALGKAPLDHLVVAIAGAGLALWGRWRSALVLIVAASIDGVQVEVVKSIADRMRPPHPLIVTGNASFPSGHTAVAAVVAVGIALAIRKRWVWACSTTVVLLMAVSRTVLDVHWLSDVVVGGAIGASTMLLVWALAPPVLADPVEPRESVPTRARTVDVASVP